MKTFIILISICFIFFLPKFCLGLPTFTYLGIEQGLSNNSVRSIYQDHNGFMWFGTFDGLNRYDGYGFKVFRNNFGDTNSLAGNFVSVIAEDKSNRIWLGTRKGVSIYNSLEDKFTNLYYKSNQGVSVKLDDVVKDIKSDDQNNMLIATEGQGLLYSHDASLNATQIPIVDGNINTSNYGVRAIQTDNLGRVWVFVQYKGLFTLDRQSMLLKPVDTTIKLANCMALDGDNLWFGTSEGVYNYNFSEKVLHRMFENIDSQIITVATLKIDNSKNIWIGTDGGGMYIFEHSKRVMQHYTSGFGKNGLSSNAVLAIYEDKQSRKWFGTLRGGVNILDQGKDKFLTVSHDAAFPNGLTGNFISALYEAPDSTLWVGTDGEGLNIMSATRVDFLQTRKNDIDTKELDKSYIVSIAGGLDNQIWISTFYSGIKCYNTSSKTFKTYRTINQKTGIENKSNYFLQIDKAGDIWETTLRVSSKLGALYKFDKILNRFLVFDDTLSDLFVLKEDKQGVFWGGNLRQLVEIDRANKKHRFYDIGEPVRSIEEDNFGNFWIGTEGGGLILFDRTSHKIVARYTTSNGICNNSILSILSDQKGNLWIGTYNGLSRFNIRAKSFKNYYQSDGLQSNQFNYNTALKFRSGAFVFGGIKGFSVFYPDEIGKSGGASPLFLTNLSIDGKPISQNLSLVKNVGGNQVSELIVPYDKAELAFGFTALEYSSPANITYAYYMQGWDKNWNNVGNIRNASYTHLPEGNYTFHVKSTDTDGNWNPNEVVLHITILPPWYRSWWAWALYILAASSLVYLYIYYKNRQTKLKFEIQIATLNIAKEKAEHEMKQAEIQKIKAEQDWERSERDKERILNEKEKEVNEKRVSFFTNISHEFRSPLTLIINPIKDLLNKQRKSDMDELNSVHRNAKRLLSLVDQLLLFRKSDIGMDSLQVSKCQLDILAHEVFLFFTNQAKSKDIDLRFNSSNKEIEIFGDKEKLEIVLYNLLSNAIKYTPTEGNVEMRIENAENEVCIFVTDSGPGIPEGSQEKLFEKFYQVNTKDFKAKPGFGIGLFLVKQFTTAHKGKVEFYNNPTGGTTFKITLPKGFSHFEESQIINNLGDEKTLIHEIAGGDEESPITGTEENKGTNLSPLVREKKSILVVDDEEEIRNYIIGTFSNEFNIYEGRSAEEGIKLAEKHLPEAIVSDIKMQGMSGIEFCKSMKENPLTSHIPFILLTGTSSQELKLEGIEGGADDYITKPFDKEILLAKIHTLLKNRTKLQNYFYNEITLNRNDQTISSEYKAFLDRCINTVEKHLDEDEFSVMEFASEMGMSYTNLFRKIKSISGLSVNVFIRFVRLRKAAEYFIDSDYNINETATKVGFNDMKYFREQFKKLFGLPPSKYLKTYRKNLGVRYKIDQPSFRSESEDEPDDEE